MTFPAVNLAPQYTDPESINEAILDATVTANLNLLAAAYRAQGTGFLGDDSAAFTTTPTFGTTSTYVAPTGVSVTLTLATQRRIRVFVSAGIQMASGTAGHYYIRANYTAGASVGTPTGVGPPIPITLTQTTSSDGRSTEGTVLLAAGQYTFFPAVERTSGGSTTDHFVDTAYVAVYDMGAV